MTAPDVPNIDPQPVHIQPEPATVDPEPEVLPPAAPATIDPEPTGVAQFKFDVVAIGEKWPHQTVEFKGDVIGIRAPNKVALTGLHFSVSKYTSVDKQDDLSKFFLAKYLSPESYGRIMSRMMDPDEPTYDMGTLSDLFNVIVEAGVEADKALESAASVAS